jgi:hypothetical protein
MDAQTRLRRSRLSQASREGERQWAREERRLARPGSAFLARIAGLMAMALAVAACPRPLPRPGSPPLGTWAAMALQRGDTRALFRVAQEVYEQHGLEFDESLVLRTHGPDTLSSFYDDEANLIVLAEAAVPGKEPRQLHALSTALFYGVCELEGAGATTAERVERVNYLVLLLAAHEQAHYLRAQYQSLGDPSDHYAAEALCNRLAVAVARHLAASDPTIALGLARTHDFLLRLFASVPSTVSAYPPVGEEARRWFNRHYELLLRREPGLYFVFQMRWWLEFLSGPAEPLGPLVDRELLRPARRHLEGLRQPALRVEIRSVRTFPSRAPAEVLAISPAGEILIEAGGRLLRIGSGESCVYQARGLPYGESHLSNYATWPEDDRLFAFRWSEGSLQVFAIALDPERREARSTEIGAFPVPERVTTISHDPEGMLYFLAHGPEVVVYRLDPDTLDLAISRRIPRRPWGHLDGPVERAAFQIGSFAVRPDGTLVFFDPSAHALRQIDESGELSTLAGGFRGLRDGRGSAARLARASHLSAIPGGLYFLENVAGSLHLRRADIRQRFWRP